MRKAIVDLYLIKQSYQNTLKTISTYLIRENLIITRLN